MRAARICLFLGAVLACASISPGAGLAGHVRVDASVAAHVERSGANSWRVEIAFSASCQGGGSGGASFHGDLSMLDLDTGESIYLGGVAGASGVTSQLVNSIDRWRRLAPVLKVGCTDDATRHGSDTIEVIGGHVLIPPRLGAGGAGRGGSRGAGGGGRGSGDDPTEPLRAGGCLTLIVGSEAADMLEGSGDAEVVFALGGDDDARGAAGHDCLVGGSGRDNLRGEVGADRLTGGPGGDRLIGGEGRNAYDAGPGRDRIDAANGRADLVVCGAGRDRVSADESDVLRGCENVTLAPPG